jgi:hypothetical protein
MCKLTIVAAIFDKLARMASGELLSAFIFPAALGT